MNGIRRLYAHNLIVSRLTGSVDQATDASVRNAATALGISEQQVANDISLVDRLAVALRDGDKATENEICITRRWMELRDDAEQSVESSEDAAHAMN